SLVNWRFRSFLGSNSSIFSSRCSSGRSFTFSATTASSFFDFFLTSVVEFVEVDQFDHRHISVISKTVTQFDDPGVSARTVSNFCRYITEQIRYSVLVAKV